MATFIMCWGCTGIGKYTLLKTQKSTDDSSLSSNKPHNPFDEDYRVSCLRENLTSSSYGEGLETELERNRASLLPDKMREPVSKRTGDLTWNTRIVKTKRR